MGPAQGLSVREIDSAQRACEASRLCKASHWKISRTTSRCRCFIVCISLEDLVSSEHKVEEASNCSWQMSSFCVQGPWREAWRSYLSTPISSAERPSSMIIPVYSRGNDEMLTCSGVRKFPRYAVLHFGTPERTSSPGCLSSSPIF